MKQMPFYSVLPRRGAFSANWRGLASAAWVTACLSVAAQESTNLMVKPPVSPLVPGGLGRLPVITSIASTQGLVTVEWFGIQGPFELLHSPAIASNNWVQIGPPTFRSRLTVPAPGDDGFFRVLGGRPVSSSETGGTVNYVGALVCLECHADTVQEWTQTPHAQAYQTLKNIGQQNNPLCVTCHTVGFGTPLGFTNEVVTAHLEGVQCENCHGPAADHIAVVRDISVRPKVTMASEMCGSCHNFHHPTYSAWKQSPHSTPVEAPAEEFIAQGVPAMMQCGPCHSGAVRESLLEGIEHPGFLLPNRIDAAYFAVTCAVCHDPHSNMPDPPRLPNPLLRNPLYSLTNYSYVPSTNLLSFSTQYNPDIQLCGQCHNMRGARWQDTARAPHHSPQYNILIGQGAFDLGHGTIAAHGVQIGTQCAYCHSASLSSTNTVRVASVQPTITSTNYFGHTTEVDFQTCIVCHISTAAAQRAVTNTQADIKGQIANVKALLDQWATNRAPADLQTKYGTLAWEYTVPGDLSNPSDSPVSGPTSAEQARVPDAIKQARFNLYLADYEGSFGVHNGTYDRTLLAIARTNVLSQLSP